MLTEMTFLFRVLAHFGRDHVSLGLKDDVMIRPDGGGVLTASERGAAGKGIGEAVPALGKRLLDLATGLDHDVQDPDRRVRKIAHAVDTIRLTRDDLDVDLAIVGVDERDLGRLEIAVAGVDLLELLGQVDPQLEPDVRAAVGVLARHLGVHDALARRHELQIARLERALVAGKVFVVEGALEQVRDRLLAPVRMIREARSGRDREVVEHQERREVSKAWRPDGAPHPRSDALGLLNCQERLADRAWDRHSCGGCVWLGFDGGSDRACSRQRRLQSEPTRQDAQRLTGCMNQASKPRLVVGVIVAIKRAATLQLLRYQITRLNIPGQRRGEQYN